MKFGGEKRVELDFHFDITDLTGRGTFDYKTRLYEGTIEDTADLDSHKEGTYALVGHSLDELNSEVLSEEPGPLDRVKARIRIEMDCINWWARLLAW